MSSQKSILVTGATGNQGSGTIRECLKQGHKVYAYVRDPTSPPAQNLASLGVTLVKGDFDDTAALEAAAKDVDAVFHTEVQTGDPAGDLRRSGNVIAAARASARVSLMIASTALKTGQHESFPGWGQGHPMHSYWLNKHAIEDLVRDAGFKQWVIIRPAHFLQNFNTPLNAMTFPGLVDDMTLRVAWKPTTRIAWLDATDVGVVAAAALTEPEKYAGREIDLATEALTIEETAGKLGKALGEPVKVHYYSDEEIAEVSKKSPVVAAHKWSNDVPGHGAAEAANEFKLSSVQSFFTANAARIRGTQ